jgi:MFS family permease
VPSELSPESRLVRLLTLAIVVGIVNGMSRVALPLYAAAVGGQPWQVGLVGGLGYAGVLLLSLPIGAWIERHGGQLLFTRGVVVAAALNLLLPQLHRPWLVVLGAGVLGLVLPFRTVPAQTEFLALLPSLSAAKAGWNRAAHTMGLFFVGPALAAALIAGFGFPPVFQLAAVGLLLSFLLGRRALSGRPLASAAPVAESFRVRLRAQFALLASQPDIRRTMAIDALTQMTVAYFVVFTLVLAVRHFGMPLQAAAGLITLQGALFVATLFFAGAWMSRRHEERHYLLAFTLLLLQGLLFGSGIGPAALWVGSALMGLGVGLQSLTSTARFAALMQRHGRGRVGGLNAVAPMAGGLVGTLGGGLLSQRWGTEAGFRLLALVFAGMVALQVWRMARERGRVADGG